MHLPCLPDSAADSRAARCRRRAGVDVSGSRFDAIDPETEAKNTLRARSAAYRAAVGVEHGIGERAVFQPSVPAPAC